MKLGGSIVLCGALCALAACERPPILPTDKGPVDEGRYGPVDFPSFLQDRPAVGGDWYLYDEEAGHLLTPFEQAYVLREGTGPATRYAAVRIYTYYDPNTADSGTFTIGYATFDDTGGWSDESEWFTAHDIKRDGPICLDLFTESDVACTTSSWQAQFRIYPFMALEGPIVVARPGLFVRSAEGQDRGDVHVATVFNPDLTALPDPRDIADFEDTVAPDWDFVSWDTGRFAVNLPQAGMALGSRAFGGGFTSTGDILFLATPRRQIVRMTLSPTVDGERDSGFDVTFSAVDIDLSDNTIPDAFPPAVTSHVSTLAGGYLKFDSDEGVIERIETSDAVPPHLPELENRWDLELVITDAGNLRLLVSPGGAIYNATVIDGATDLDTAMPPR
jgi:hypothetical protein